VAEKPQSDGVDGRDVDGADSGRTTPTYVQGTRSPTPGSGSVPARSTLMGSQSGEPLMAPGLTPPIASPSAPPRATPGGSPMVTGVLDTRNFTPGGTAVPRNTTPRSLVTAPAPRTATPSGSHITIMGTPIIPPRHSTPGTGAPAPADPDRNLSPSQQAIPEELRQKATGSSRTRIGLPSVLPGLFRKRETAEGQEPGSGSAPSPAGPHPGGVTQPRGGRETVLLNKVKRPGHGTPSGGSPSVALARRETPPESRGHGRKVRPAVAPAEIHPIKQAVSPDPSRLVVLDQKRIPQGAAIRSLRHRLAERGDPRVILVSSANARDGKTFCAANLALALAEIRRSRVLLLEANVHRPGLAELFGLRKPQSFFAQLEQHRHNIAAPWNVTELSTHDLHLLAIDPTAAQHTPGNANAAIDGAFFATCMDSLRGAYEYIIVDGPAVSAGPDVSLLEDAVDGIVFVARSDRSHASALRNALDQISPQDLLGVVLLEV
jgi:Mrp family chromosome partitioning ATPase